MGGIEDRKTGDGAAMRAGEGQRHHGPDVVPAHGVMLEPERLHDAVNVGSQGRLVIAALRAIRMACATKVEGDDGMGLGQSGHYPAPFPPSLREAVDQDQRRSLAADDRMDFHRPGLHHLMAKRL